MNTVGIIAEYNPFHNGHLYHLNKVKEMFPNHLIVLVISGNYTQKGTFSIIEKYDKAKIALTYGIDLIVELPYNFVVQCADEFAKGSIQILNDLGVKNMVFGSESNDIDKLKEFAQFSIKELEKNKHIKENIKKGNNYPKVISELTKSKFNYTIDKPNDILGICYIKEILKNNYDIIPYSIKRNNDYNDLSEDNDIISASNIREKIKNKRKITKYIPKDVEKFINSDMDYSFEILKYNILNNIDNLEKFLLVDKSLSNLIKKHIHESNNKQELISKIKNKSNTYSMISRALCNIVCNYKKTDKYDNVTYLNILGSSKKGLEYLKTLKKKVKINLITKFSDYDKNTQELEYRINYIYNHKKESKKSLKETKIII